MTDLAGWVPRDAKHQSAAASKQVVGDLVAETIQTNRLTYRGMDLADWIAEASVMRDTDSFGEPNWSVPTQERQPSSPVHEFDEPVPDPVPLARRAMSTSQADVARQLYDPIGARQGRFLTCDAFGRGKWADLPVAPTPVSRSGLTSTPVHKHHLAVFADDTGQSLAEIPVRFRDQQLCLDQIVATTLSAQKLVLTDIQPLTQSTQSTPAWRPLGVDPAGRLVVQPPELEEADRERTALIQTSAEIAATLRKTVRTPESSNSDLLSTIAEESVGSDRYDEVVDTLTDVAESVADLQEHALRLEGGRVAVAGCIETQHLDSQVIETRQLTAEHATASHLHVGQQANLAAVTANQLLTNQLTLDPNSQNVTGKVLVAKNAEGRVGWGRLPPTLLPHPETCSPDHVPVFQRHNHRTTLGNSSVSITPAGLVECTNLSVSHGNALLHGSEVLVASRQHSLFLGNQSANLAAGDGALAKGARGSQGCVAVGTRAMHNASERSHVLALGDDTLCEVQVDEIVALGYKSQARNKTGLGNVSVGPYSLGATVEGAFNTAVGHRALAEALEDGNCAVGSDALSKLTQGSGNTACGAGAGDKLQKGKYTTCLGFQATPIATCRYGLALGAFAEAKQDGDLALGSAEAPLRLTPQATSGAQTMLNPATYLEVRINGQPYKLALYTP